MHAITLLVVASLYNEEIDSFISSSPLIRAMLFTINYATPTYFFPNFVVRGILKRITMVVSWGRVRMNLVWLPSKGDYS